MTNATFTYHCQYERANRVQHIVEEIGVGQIVKKSYTHGCYTCITDTGVTIIKTADEAKIITMYVTTYKELVAIYNGEKKIPPFLKKKVNHNQSKFTNQGKTIW